MLWLGIRRRTSRLSPKWRLGAEMAPPPVVLTTPQPTALPAAGPCLLVTRSVSFLRRYHREKARQARNRRSFHTHAVKIARAGCGLAGLREADWPVSDSAKKRRLERHEGTRRAQRGTCTGRRIFRSKAARKAPFA